MYGDAFRDGIKRQVYLGYLRARFARVYPLHFVTLFWILGALVLLSLYLDMNEQVTVVLFPLLILATAYAGAHAAVLYLSRDRSVATLTGTGRLLHGYAGGLRPRLAVFRGVFDGDADDGGSILPVRGGAGPQLSQPAVRNTSSATIRRQATFS